MLLIVNAGMKDNPVTYGVVGSSLRDFNRTWFKIVGNTIVGTLLLNVIMPILESVFYKFLKVCYRAMDRGCCQKDKYVTNMTSIAEYIDLYSGIDFEMQDGFNAFLIIVFVTFMFGFGIPLMFPIATVAMYVLSCTEEYNLYYFYRQPPMYDDTITQKILALMRLAPFCYFITAYWMLSNQQILSNEHLHPLLL